MTPRPLSCARIWRALSHAQTPDEWDKAREMLPRLEAIDAPFSNSRTLLMMAAAKGNEKAADLLLAAGADPNACTWVPGYNHTALFYAIDGTESKASTPESRAAVVRRLLSAGATATGEDTWSAACCQSAAVALLLLEGGTLPKVRRGTTVFDEVLAAAASDFDNGRTQDWDAVFERLRALGADPAKVPSGRRSPPVRLRPLVEEESFPFVQALWERHRLAAELAGAMPNGSRAPIRRMRL